MSHTPSENQARSNAAVTGRIPPIVGVMLTSFVILAIVTLSWVTGLSMEMLGMVVVSGLVASVGVQLSTEESIGVHTVGVICLWVAALIFTGALIVLVGELSVVFIAVILSASTLLATYGIASSSVQSFGHGAGKAVLLRYFIGMVIVASVASVLFIGNELSPQLLSDVRSWGFGVWSGAQSVESVGGRFFISFFLFALFLTVLRFTVNIIPYEVFTTPSMYEYIHSDDGLVNAVNGYSSLILGFYVSLFIFGIIIRIIVPTDLGGIVFAAILIISHPTVLNVLGAFTFVVALVFVGLQTVRLLDRFDTNSPMEIILPPITLLPLIWVAWELFSGSIIDRIEGSDMVTSLDSDGVLYQLLVPESFTMFLFTASVSLLFFAAVLATPTLVTKGTPGDQSVAGITTSVVGLVSLAVIGAYVGVSTWVVLLFIAIGVIVWEVSEFSLVLSGEIGDVTGNVSNIDRVGEVITLHVITSILIGVIAVGITLSLLTILGTASIGFASAILGITASVIGLSILLVLLRG